jgi:hypothetical protein
MPKTPKILLVFLALVAAVSLLIGCSNTNDKQPSTENNSNNDSLETTTDRDLAATYSLDTDKITVWYCGEDSFFYRAFEITDPAEIQQMIAAVDLAAWEISQNNYTGFEHYWIQFGDNSTIAIYQEVPYGYITKTIPEKNSHYLENDSLVHYDMPEQLLTTLVDFIEKYRPGVRPQ